VPARVTRWPPTLQLVLAVCERASIATTKGTVVFDPDEGRIEKPRQKRERGSVFQGRIKLTRDEYRGVCDYLRSLLLPDTVLVTFNGDRLLPRKPIRTFETSLETLVADEDGVMRLRVRKTRVNLFEVLAGETRVCTKWAYPSSIPATSGTSRSSKRCRSTGTEITCGPPTCKRFAWPC
jgi:hypothetical protein